MPGAAVLVSAGATNSGAQYHRPVFNDLSQLPYDFRLR
jgi:hypothetical protein